MTLYADEVFAPLDHDLHLERIGGGNETEVYCTDDRRFVVKLKSDLGGDVAAVLATAETMRLAAERFAAALGSEYTIPSHYLVARDSAGRVQVLVVQPFIEHARPLYAIDYAGLSSSEREHIAAQLREIIRRALLFYRKTGSMPDLYGRSSTSKSERERLNTPGMLPWRLWSFLVQRNLLRSHNLLLTDAPDRRVFLIDYDPVRKGWFYLLVYYGVRWNLFWRDHALIQRMRRHGIVPWA
ncbi:MAG: hypothetical protein ACLFVO_08455 [Chloroflexaceae bacterium]